MKRVQAVAIGALVALGALLPPMQSHAQVAPAQQQAQQQAQRMQEQIQRLTESLQRMTRIQERAHEMEQQMLRDMEQIRLQEQLQLQDQERLRNQEQIRSMAHAMSGAAGEMAQAMIGLREMAQNGTQGINAEMEQLRQHFEEACDQMEAGLHVMEQLRDRLGET